MCSVVTVVTGIYSLQGTMANMFYHPIGIVLYYICICLYLYGDMSIYAAAIPKSFKTAVW